MRFIFLCCFFFFSCMTKADELILPDNFAAKTQSTSNQTNEMINTEHQALSTDDKKTPPELSAAEAAELIGKKFPGQIVSVNLQEDGLAYAVKVLNNGHMKTHYVDAYSGKISKLSD